MLKDTAHGLTEGLGTTLGRTAGNRGSEVTNLAPNTGSIRFPHTDTVAMGDLRAYKDASA